jgi:hypothetical protein
MLKITTYNILEELLNFGGNKKSIASTHLYQHQEMKKTILTTAIFIAIILIVTSCLPGENPVQDVPSDYGSTAGFLKGLWHGIIAPVTFVISLFTENINMYEVHNNGGWYDFGFVIGAGIIFSGSGRASHKRK